MNSLGPISDPTTLSLMKDPSALGRSLSGGASSQSNFADFANAQNYNDINALQRLKYKSGDQREAALETTAKHFESLFVSMMIKSMRDANKVFSEGNMLQSSQSDFYQQMFDSQLSVSLSSGKGIGLAEVIKKQLAQQNTGTELPSQQSFALNQEKKFYSLEDYARLPSSSVEKVEQVREVIAKIDQQLQGSPNATKEAQSLAHIDIDFSSPEKYIESLYPVAKMAEQESGIDARLMLAQSALETGWGKHQIYREDGRPSHNMFGIKAHRDWSGEETNILTTEYRSGVALKERANFRAYDSYLDSFKDYAQFLRSNSRYEEALASADDPKDFAQALQSAGYATDPNYANKIHRILDQYMGSFETERQQSMDPENVDSESDSSLMNEEGLMRGASLEKGLRLEQGLDLEQGPGFEEGIGG